MLGRRSSLRSCKTNAPRISSANAASIGLPIALDSRITIASTTPIVSTGNPLDFRSNHT